ncbi:hypothetical protein DY000_02039576 [Brassica cretica]|uniref:Uncharacterized protein n=1 Tax=Brassica cretica TaxID=69181 RepID=A0ABQ7BEH2_BRACR|nr:hypothetical protein DY000_02039576 [Brassica cretica]
MELNADYLEGFFGLSQTRVKHLYSFKPRRHMEIVKGFTTNDYSWRDYFFFVRLDEASIAEECLRAFKRSWGRRVCDPIPTFPEDLFVVQDILRGGVVFWGHFSPERVHAAVALHQSRFCSSVEEDAEPTIEDSILSRFLAQEQWSRMVWRCSRLSLIWRIRRLGALHGNLSRYSKGMCSVFRSMLMSVRAECGHRYCLCVFMAKYGRFNFIMTGRAWLLNPYSSTALSYEI